ncbi:MAG: response regulator transcription factor [Bacteroidia bacterium]
MAKIKKIIILDAQPVYGLGLEKILWEHKVYRVKASVTLAAVMFEYIGNDAADLVILDLNLNDANGFDVLKQLKSDFPRIKVLIHTNINDSFSIQKCFSLDADGFVHKAEPVNKIVEALDAIANGDKYVPTYYVAERMAAIARGHEFVPKPLSPKEIIVLRHICEGKTSQVIANELGLSVHTVNNHRKSIKKKTNCQSTIDLHQYATINGLL